MNIFEMEAIDIHTHINSNSPYDTKTNESYHADLVYLNEMRMAAKVGPTFCSTFASVLDNSTIEEENAYLYKLCETQEYLYQWVVVDPRKETTFVQAKQMLHSGKCMGMKLHPVYHKYSLDEYGDKIFAFAEEHSAVVLIHPEKAATQILPMADKYPNVKFIMAHLNGDPKDHIEAIKLAKHGNIYTDTATGSSTKNAVIEYAVNQIGSEKIFFGTDTYAAGFQRGRIAYAMISEEDKRNILRNNALRVFGKLEKNEGM